MDKRFKQVRRDTIELMRLYGGTHFGGSLSCVEILVALYDSVLTKDDIFILSKGHACWPLYVLLRERGLNPKMEAHPHMDAHNGIHCTTGSLGHGLPFALGIALAKKIKGEPGRVYVLMGDGECQEGTLWESLNIAKNQEINNITVIIDKNGIQGSRNTAPMPLMSLGEILNWRCVAVNGHEVKTLERVFSTTSPEIRLLVKAITTKGRGVSFMENKIPWHSKPLSPELEERAMEELR